ncbi:MAG: DUF4143 domain-containing protein [Streptomycetales bacterium]
MSRSRTPRAPSPVRVLRLLPHDPDRARRRRAVRDPAAERAAPAAGHAGRPIEIPAWSTGHTRRAVGTRKLAYVDSGFACHLLVQDLRRLGEPDGAAGPMVENFVLMELARQLTWSDERALLYHYRTKDKTEVDAVLETVDGRVVGVEVKAGSTVRAEDLAGLRHLAERVGPWFVAGYVLYTGQQTLPFGHRLRALPIDALWRMAP